MIALLIAFARRLAPSAWIVGIVALTTGGYCLIVHLTSGSRVFHFELVAIGVGLALLWERLTGRRTKPNGTTRRGRLLAIFGIIAILVGLQGLFTPDG